MTNRNVKIPSPGKPHLHLWKGYWRLEPARRYLCDDSDQWESAHMFRHRLNNDINNEVYKRMADRHLEGGRRSCATLPAPPSPAFMDKMTNNALRDLEVREALLAHVLYRPTHAKIVDTAPPAAGNWDPSAKPAPTAKPASLAKQAIAVTYLVLSMAAVAGMVATFIHMSVN